MTEPAGESWLRLTLSQPDPRLVLASVSSYISQLPDPVPGTETGELTQAEIYWIVGRRDQTRPGLGTGKWDGDWGRWRSMLEPFL